MSNPYAPPQPGQPPADGASTPTAPGAPGPDGSTGGPAGSPRGPYPGPVPPRPFPSGPGASGPGSSGPAPHGPHPQSPHPQGPLPPGGAVPPPGVRPPLPPADPADVARAGRLIRHFGVYLLAAIAVSMLPLPWQAASLVFVVGALLSGLRALGAVRLARLGGVMPMLVAGLVMTGLLLMATLYSLSGWTAATERQDCLRTALTESARVACEQQYEDALLPQTGEQG